MQQGEFAIDQAEEEFSDTVFTIETLIQFEAEFVGIDRAIEALQRGTYGQCEVCSTTIAPSRLRNDPVLVRCDAHIVRETPALFGAESELHEDESFEASELFEGDGALATGEAMFDN
jgi:hypothetical protein